MYVCIRGISKLADQTSRSNREKKDSTAVTTEIYDGLKQKLMKSTFCSRRLVSTATSILPAGTASVPQ